MISSPQNSTFPNPSTAEQTAPARHLRILAGLHAGASRTLSAQDMLVVGSSDDCDVVLADAGVAPHHALLSTLGQDMTLRALDAPLRIGAQTLHPGDPVKLEGLHRVSIGEAVFAAGGADDPAWATLLPESSLAGIARPAKPRAGLWRLSAIVATAGLVLVSVAIYAAVTPEVRSDVASTQRIDALIKQHNIADGQLTQESHGTWILSGTVEDAGVRDRIQQQLLQQGIEATLDLRTGEDIARSVAEVMRAEGQNVQTRWLGNGDVELTGRFEDENALRSLVGSRAMLDVHGVKRVIPRNLIQPVNAPTAKPAAAEPVRIVAVVKGKDAHVVGDDGTKYKVGAELPGGAKLIAIGSKAWTLNEGKVEAVTLSKRRRPPTPPPPTI